ncbi:bifunctional UDP-N-acetylglucosamine diphosphorylase/glucosamine-1-phosphate N-acetyltransferase GlmU [Proteinivorax hydrogeniformans]|uniref:Bifunctional protein GlmU n=1 Tax=Proteinivorax hydrogeniformans TaxID=1826727 RepID=A0AAU8HTZ3_9FIRM
MDKSVAAVVLAAGKGTRMKSKKSKVLHTILDKPMLEYIYDALDGIKTKKVVTVVGHQKDQIIDRFDNRSDFVTQDEQLGTGHAVMQAEGKLKDFPGHVLILCGDTPLLTSKTLKKLTDYHLDGGYEGTILTAHQQDPSGYGRVIRGEQNNVTSVVEQKDATESQKKIKEVNTGIFIFKAKTLFKLLKNVENNNAQGEYYLPDVLKIMIENQMDVGAMQMEDSTEMIGINDRVMLQHAQKVMQNKINLELMQEGVTIIDPESTYISPECRIAQDVTVYPMTFLKGNTMIEEGAVIGPNATVVNSKIGRNTVVVQSQVQDSEVRDDVQVGPFTHIRPKCVVSNKVKLGNFVEIKNAKVGEGSKASHLSYLGDCTVEEGVNIGCGTITVNYDGRNKHHTLIKKGAFIGSNSNLIAPITVGEDGFVAAGSTVSKDVPSESLVIARGRETVKKNWRKK